MDKSKIKITECDDWVIRSTAPMADGDADGWELVSIPWYRRFWWWITWNLGGRRRPYT